MLGRSVNTPWHFNVVATFVCHIVQCFFKSTFEYSRLSSVRVLCCCIVGACPSYKPLHALMSVRIGSFEQGSTSLFLIVSFVNGQQVPQLHGHMMRSHHWCIIRQRLFITSAWHLSVCLLGTLRKNYWIDLHENFTTDVSVDKEELIKFWKSSGSGNFGRILRHCNIGHFFHRLAYISGDSDRIVMKMLSKMYPWTMKSQLNFGSGVRIWILTPDPDHILLCGRMWSVSAVVLARHYVSTAGTNMIGYECCSILFIQRGLLSYRSCSLPPLRTVIACRFLSTNALLVCILCMLFHTNGRLVCSVTVRLPHPAGCGMRPQSEALPGNSFCVVFL